MNTSFCTIAFRNEQLSLEQIILLVKDAGYDGVEVWVNHVPQDQKLSALQESLSRKDLRVTMVSPYFDLTGTREALRESLIKAESVFGAARDLGAPLVRVFTGIVGSSEADAAVFSQCVEGLQHLCDMAASKSINLALETHPKTLTDSTDATLNIIEAVARENLGVNLDIYHLWEIGEDPLDSWERLRERVFNVHAKNASLKPLERRNQEYRFLHDKQARQTFKGITGLRSGDMDYAPFLSKLVKDGYEGHVAIEWFGPEPARALRDELSYLRSFG